MKPFVTLLFASLLFLVPQIQLFACNLNPTAKIVISPGDNTIFTDSDNFYLHGAQSSANCGSITSYQWKVDGISQSTTSSYFFPSFSLYPGQQERSYSIQLRVQNSVGNYDYETVTITIVREHSSYYYLTDHLGSVRVTVDEQGNSVGWDDYYPFGLQMPGRTQNNSNPNDDQKFTGYELEQQGDLGLYHAGARMYDPVIGRFNSQDRFKEKYPSMSPYQYAANNPIYFIDVNGDSLDVSHLDDDTLDWLTGQLQTLTGLTLSVNDNGMLNFDQDTEVNTDGTSETARNDLMSAIGHESVWTVNTQEGFRPSHIKRNDHEISLNIEDIRYNEENSVGVSSLTRGIGMTLIHELNHTPIVPSGGTADDGGPWDKGSTVRHMNAIRHEISQGGRYMMGTRQWYGPFLWDDKGAYIPFNRSYTRRVYSRIR